MPSLVALDHSARKTKAVVIIVVVLTLLGSSVPARWSWAEQPTIGGVYEVGIGTTDPLPLIRYWQQFGYRPGPSGELSAAEALRLYGVNSRLRSIRLLHQDADHGLIRLMVWERPTSEGLGLSHMKVKGNRWGAMLTADVYNLLNHAEVASSQGLPVYYVPPQLAQIYPPERPPTPFLDPLVCVREMVLIQPLTRQVLFQRFNYQLPLYGRIDESSHFRTSQITHVGMVVQGDRRLLDFYDHVLGLLRVRDQKVSGDTDPSARAIFELEPGQWYVSTDFDDPRSSATDPQKMRSGRLKIIWFPPDVRLEDKLALSRPGALGYSLYTYRVSSIEAYHARVKASTATSVTEIYLNEFGEKSFSFVAPDGYFWTLVQQPHHQ